MNESERSFAPITQEDLARLGRTADADLELFFRKNPERARWRARVVLVALAQGGAEHYLRGERGVRDLDVIVCFAALPGEVALLRRSPVVWDWGPSKFGRNPHESSSYEGRAVDVQYWVVPDRREPAGGVQEWLRNRRGPPDRNLAHAPVVSIWPAFDEVLWDPGPAPRPGTKTKPHPPTRHRAPA